jgi:IS1 family transposase
MVWCRRIRWIRNICRLKKSGCDRAVVERRLARAPRSGNTPRRRKAQGNACQDNKIWLWTAVDHFKTGILGWVLGDHSAKTLANLWKVVGQGQCHFYVTGGWKVYPNFIPEVAQILSKTYMTRVEGENTRPRHYLARLHRKTLCYSRVWTNAQTFNSIINSLPKI